MATTTASVSAVSPELAIDLSRIPDWLLIHPELRKRGIIVHEPLQPFTVYQTKWTAEGPIYVVKALKPLRPEADIYERLDQCSDSPTNHTIPHEVIQCEPPLVGMPFASRIVDILTYKTSSILAAFDQILEGVEHMHRLRISHGDIFVPNVIAATEEDAKRDTRLTAGRVYLIDFETSRQFEHCPGIQTAVPLPNTHVVPPLGMKTFDPFSWDVYCFGITLEDMVLDKFIYEPEAEPWIPHLFAGWLKGKEVLAIVRWFVDVAELVTAIVLYPTTLFKTRQAELSHGYVM